MLPPKVLVFERISASRSAKELPIPDVQKAIATSDWK